MLSFKGISKRFLKYSVKFQKAKYDGINLEWSKTLEYLKIQESLQSENPTEYYLCKGLF